MSKFLQVVTNTEYMQAVAAFVLYVQNEADAILMNEVEAKLEISEQHAADFRRSVMAKYGALTIRNF